MELEISVEDLLNKRKIESDCIEFKAGWNPDDIYHSVCAFANDYNNDGGGYIAVGVEEKNGVAVRPVKGIPEYMLDEIQKEMLSYNNMIAPPISLRRFRWKLTGNGFLLLWRERDSSVLTNHQNMLPVKKTRSIIIIFVI
jgi:ATP-dependent DNA helicase RecG